jgi:hypothetical protein
MPRLSIDSDAIFARLRKFASADVCENCELPVTSARQKIVAFGVRGAL